MAMTQHKLILGLVVAFSAIVAVIPAFGQGGTNTQTGKQAIETAQAAEEATSQVEPHAPKLAATLVPSCPDTTPVQVGVFPYPDDPAAFGFGAVNMATGVGSDGNKYDIYAGGTDGDSPQGVLIVWETIRDTCAAVVAGKDISPQPITYTYSAGPLTLTGVNRDLVSFEGPQSVIGHFNYVTGQFLP